MSTVGLRSYEYQRATDVDHNLRDLVARVGSASSDPTSARQARMQLALELETLAGLLDPLAEGATLDIGQSLRVPVPMLRRLRSTQLNDKPLTAALNSTVEHLRADDDLTEDDFRLLRVVLDAASHEASDAFDRVVRR